MKNLFQDLLKDRDLISPEPYRIWEYYNQKCNLAQAYDIAINDKGIRDLPRPNLRLSKEELLLARKMIAEVKEKTGKDKVIVFQPFGRGAQPEELKEKATYVDPHQYSTGMKWVLVNGKIALKDGKKIEGRFGKVVRSKEG